MSRKDPLHIEEVDSLDPPKSKENDGRAEQTIVHPIAMPPAIYRAYADRQFRLLREAKERVRGVLLDMDTWNVLWQVDGRRTVGEIAENLMLPLNETVYHLECLKLMGIVCPVDAIYLPEFILEKTEKRETGKKRRRSDTGSKG